MSGRKEPLYPKDPVLLEKNNVFVFEKNVYNGTLDVNCFEVFEISRCLFLACSVVGKMIIYNLDEDKIETSVDESGLSNHMCFHPRTRTLYYEMGQQMHSIDMGSESNISKNICDNPSGVCNTSYGSGTTTQIIQTLRKGEIVFPSKSERSIVVFDCILNMEEKKVDFTQGASRCLTVKGNFMVVGGSTRFTVFDKKDFSIINTAEGSQFGFVYGVNIVNSKFLVAGSYNGETYVYTDYSKKGAIKLVHRWKFSNGYTNVLTYRNNAIISFKTNISMNVLQFNEENYRRVEEEGVDPKRVDLWNYSILEPKCWHKLAKWVTGSSERKRIFASLSRNCKEILFWRNTIYERRHVDPDAEERMEFILDFDHEYLFLGIENTSIFRIGNEMKIWKSFLFL